MSLSRSDFCGRVGFFVLSVFRPHSTYMITITEESRRDDVFVVVMADVIKSAVGAK